MDEDRCDLVQIVEYERISPGDNCGHERSVGVGKIEQEELGRRRIEEQVEHHEEIGEVAEIDHVVMLCIAVVDEVSHCEQDDREDQVVQWQPGGETRNDRRCGDCQRHAKGKCEFVLSTHKRRSTNLPFEHLFLTLKTILLLLHTLDYPIHILSQFR